MYMYVNIFWFDLPLLCFCLQDYLNLKKLMVSSLEKYYTSDNIDSNDEKSNLWNLFFIQVKIYQWIIAIFLGNFLYGSPFRTFYFFYFVIKSSWICYNDLNLLQRILQSVITNYRIRYKKFNSLQQIWKKNDITNWRIWDKEFSYEITNSKWIVISTYRFCCNKFRKKLRQQSLI